MKSVFLIVCTVFSMYVHAERNYVINGNMQVVDGGTSGSLINGAGGYTATKMYVGPGQGAGVNWSIQSFAPGQTAVPGNPQNYLRLTWTSVATAGEAQYLPAFRYTFFEHYITNAWNLYGQSIDYQVYARVASGSVYVVPIIWSNWQNGDYTIWSLPGMTVTTSWTPIAGTFAMPAIPAGKVMTPQNYIGFGLDYVYPTAPTIEISAITIGLHGTSIEPRPFALEQYLSRN